MARMTDAERAERLSAKRARMLPVLAILFVAQQGVYFTSAAADPLRTVDAVKISAWLVLSVVLLLVLVTGGGWAQPRRVRDLANDELTQAHRSQAFRVGFIAAMIGCVAIYFLTMFEPVGGREAIHLVMTIGIAAALVRFGMLERRALRGA